MNTYDDITNLFNGINENIENDLIDFIASGNMKCLNRSTCRDIFNLNCIKSSNKNRLEICKILIENQEFVDLAVEEYASIIDKIPCFYETQENSGIIDEILYKLIKIRLQDDLILRLLDSLEKLYICGWDKYTNQIMQLFKSLDSNIKSMEYTPIILRAKIALLSYGATKYNASNNLLEMHKFYQGAKKMKLKNMMGMIYYYHGIFYKRTNYRELYIPLKNGYSYFSLEEGCFSKAKDKGFWLADYVM